jgi:hypothetical protein
MKWMNAYFVLGTLIVAIAYIALLLLAVRTRMRPSLVAVLGLVLTIATVAAAAYMYETPKPETPTSPRFQEAAGQSAAGKNDATTGKEEGTRAREIQQSAGPLRLTDEQRRQLQDFTARRREPALDKVNFSITIGAAVPRQVELRDLPTDLSDALHGYNGDKYILVRDQMIIVDSQARRIVAIVPGMEQQPPQTSDR